jgi:hypothetical protein
MSNPFWRPSRFENNDEALVTTVRHMYKDAMERTTSKVDAAKLMQEQYVVNDVRMLNAIRQGYDIAAMFDNEGDGTALDFLRAGPKSYGRQAR